MSTMRILRDNGTIPHPLTDANSIALSLALRGVRYERWPLEQSAAPGRSLEQVIHEIGPELERLERHGGYHSPRVVKRRAGESGDPIQSHQEDEACFVLEGSGRYRLRFEREVVELNLEAGDLLVVPARVPHEFKVTGECDFVSVLLTPLEPSAAASR
jgi:1,2-dihydroxy-3-keto-5-methylthiopentene dioxygenase